MDAFLMLLLVEELNAQCTLINSFIHAANYSGYELICWVT